MPIDVKFLQSVIAALTNKFKRELRVSWFENIAEMLQTVCQAEYPELQTPRAQPVSTPSDVGSQLWRFLSVLDILLER